MGKSLYNRIRLGRRHFSLRRLHDLLRRYLGISSRPSGAMRARRCK